MKRKAAVLIGLIGLFALISYSQVAIPAPGAGTLLSVGDVKTLQVDVVSVSSSGPFVPTNSAATATGMTAVSSNPLVITVASNGMPNQFTVTAVGVGSATITITASNLSAVSVSTTFAVSVVNGTAIRLVPRLL